MQQLCDFSLQRIGRSRIRYTAGGYRYKGLRESDSEMRVEDRIVRDYSAMLHRLPSAYEARMECAAPSPGFLLSFSSRSRSNKTIRMPAKDPNDRSVVERVVLCCLSESVPIWDCRSWIVVVVGSTTISLSNTCTTSALVGLSSAWAWVGMGGRGQADVWDLAMGLASLSPPIVSKAYRMARSGLSCATMTGQSSPPTPLYYCAFSLSTPLIAFPIHPSSRQVRGPKPR
ncbi:hypothetical protein BKA61DRAFT_97340 [Leptodontidium sp. MPI-SDFR-AT-0119]|nr:hypothetical protein BKA61DRAFT_97340 [Leptodontidium sp. MPI-SDFR-AT-0119]